MHRAFEAVLLLASLITHVAGSSASCSEYSACAGLDGDCCPTEHGIVLSCCMEGRTAPQAPKRRTRPADRDALTALWEANGKQGVMYGWGVGDPCNGEVDSHALANSQGFGPWKGVGCTPCSDEPELDCVYQIYLHQKSLNGTIPETFRDLPELYWLFLSANNLTGPLPADIWSTMPKLSMLDLSYNTIDGDLNLTGISKSPRLRRVLLNDNHFDSISYSGGGFEQLSELNFMYNRNMSGMMPQAIGNLASLQFLYIHDTNLTGEAPQVPFRRAKHVILSGNGALCGAQNEACYRDWTYCDIHEDFGTCPSDTPKFKWGLDFDFGSTGRRGRRGIGTRIGVSDGKGRGFGVDLEKGRRGRGRFGVDVGDRRRKFEIYGSKDRRRKAGFGVHVGKAAAPTQTRPSDRDALLALWDANGRQGVMYGWGVDDPCVGKVDPHAVANNQGFGPWKGVGCVPCSDDPKFFCVSQIWLHQKSLNGTIPEGFKGLRELGWLFLSANNITGPFPTSIWETMPKLSLLDISYNQITGDLNLDSLQSNSKLLRLLANDNHFDSITYNGGGFSSLVELNFMYNRNMTGVLPYSLGSLPSLQFLYIHDTNLTGEVPVESWPYIHHLILSGNGNLCGALPPVCSDPETWCDLQENLGDCPSESESTNLIASMPEEDEMKERVVPASWNKPRILI